MVESNKRNTCINQILVNMFEISILISNKFIFFSLLKSFHTIEAKLSDKLFPFKYQRDMISSVKVCRDLNKGIGEKNKTLIRGAIIVFRKKMVWEDERNI